MSETQSEWQDLFWSTTALMSTLTGGTLPNWMANALVGHLPDETFKILVEKLLHGPDVQHLLKRAAKPNAYQSNPEQDAKDAEDIKALRVWSQILSSPIEKLPTLLGVREDLDDLIAKRMKE